MKRVASIAVMIAMAVLAWKMGGGAEPPTAPRAEAAEASRSVEGDTYEAAVRLVEVASEATFRFPQADARRAVIKSHWRQQRPPHLKLAGDAARFVANVALRTSASETQWAMALEKKGEAWAPDARLWSVNEGSFDQREAFLAPGPGAIALRVTVPRGARFTFAEGTLNTPNVATVFVVRVVDARGRTHEPYRHVLEPAFARRWTDASCDLSAFAGQTVELSLHVETTRANETAPRPADPAASASTSSGPGNARVVLDGGAAVEELLQRPSSPVALWGNPTLFARTTAAVPYNVLWIVVDALRPDVLAAFHDDAEDAAKRAAPYHPLEALLPKVPGLAPSIDELTRQGVRFTHAYSAGSWTRPGTIAMLAGARSSELGIDATTWMLGPSQAARVHADDPPFLSLALRRRGVTTRAFVNNYFMVGYAPVGVDMGFERVDDHRYRTRDTLEITKSATSWIRANAATRFFAFVNYNSPHEPYEPPKQFVERLPKDEPKDNMTRLYMAEAAKDDEAIGILLRALDEAHIRDRTLIVLTADHGETLSSAHSGTSGLEQMPIRYHHAVSNYEETTKVPILLVLPTVLPADREVKARARTIDIAPTVLDLLGLEPHPRMSGRSLRPLAEGKTEDERVVVSEGRGSRAIYSGKHRLIVREGAARTIVRDGVSREAELELFDLSEDPGERHDLAERRPALVAEMRARLDAALENVPVVGSRAPEPDATPRIHLRFAGGPSPRRVTGTIVVGATKTMPRRFEVTPIELGADAMKLDGARLELAFRTSAAAVVGFDLDVDPGAIAIGWELWLDDGPWPESGVFGGPFGLPAPSLRGGLTSDDARTAAQSLVLPHIDPKRDVGIFVTRERKYDGETHEPAEEGAEEMTRLLREWGYARGSSP
jgi:arylsulfatase A-like enzyme